MGEIGKRTKDIAINTIYVVNSFSLGMIPRTKRFVVEIEEIDANQARERLAKSIYVSYVGHEATAQLLSELLKLPIPANRERLMLLPNHENLLLLAQIKTRLPEGKTLTYSEIKELYDKGEIQLYFLRVYIE